MFSNGNTFRPNDEGLLSWSVQNYRASCEVYGEIKSTNTKLWTFWGIIDVTLMLTTMNYGNLLIVQLVYSRILSLWLDWTRRITYPQFINTLEIHRTSKDYVPTWLYLYFQTIALIWFWAFAIVLNSIYNVNAEGDVHSQPSMNSSFKILPVWLLFYQFAPSWPVAYCMGPTTNSWGDLSRPIKVNKNRKSGKIKEKTN